MSPHSGCQEGVDSRTRAWCLAVRQMIYGNHSTKRLNGMDDERACGSGLRGQDRHFSYAKSSPVMSLHKNVDKMHRDD